MQANDPHPERGVREGAGATGVYTVLDGRVTGQRAVPRVELKVRRLHVLSETTQRHVVVSVVTRVWQPTYNCAAVKN